MFSIVSWSHWSSYNEKSARKKIILDLIHLPSFIQIDTIFEDIYKKMSQNNQQNSISVSVLLTNVMFLLCNYENGHI